MGEIINFERADGKTISGYYAAPEAGDEAPGIVVIQEWWGLNDQIKGVADRFAKEGYRALVPDLYRGKVTLDAAEAEHLMSRLDFGDAATQDISGALRHLKTGGTKVGVIGFCMGGVLSILAAARTDDADAAVPWYGLPPEGSMEPGDIKIPLQGHYALRDEHFTPAQVDALEAKLKEAGVNYAFYRYEADHGFGNETGERYDPESAKLAWQRSLDFLAKHIR
jgi:carboxymethylenebutenolidase